MKTHYSIRSGFFCYHNCVFIEVDGECTVAHVSAARVTLTLQVLLVALSQILPPPPLGGHTLHT
jgi:hypothetical protein